jgi:uncharacterized protein
MVRAPALYADNYRFKSDRANVNSKIFKNKSFSQILDMIKKKYDMETEQQCWRTLNGRRVQGPIEDEIRRVVVAEKEAGNELKVCIGTDSQVKGRETEFATVIVFIRKGKGGFMYIRSETSRQPMRIKERMLLEVSKSIEVAYELCNIFTFYGVDMEVHADINTNPSFKSNDALKEAMGYIVGMGFDFKAKPDAFASSACANKVVQ